MPDARGRVSLSRVLVGEDGELLHDADFQLLVLANTMAPLGVALLSPMLETLVGPFNTSLASIGLMVSVFTAPSIVIIPVAGVLADRFTRKRILVVSLVGFGVAGTAIALTTDFSVVLGLRLVQGMAYAGLTPIIITTIGDSYAGTTEVTAQGLRFTSSGLSLTLFPVISGVLVGVSWQYPFLIYSLAVPIGLAVWYWFDEPATGASASDLSVESYLATFRELVGHTRVAAMLLARSLGTVLWTGFLTYNSVVVSRLLAGTASGAGLLVGIGSLCFAGASSQAGRLEARFGNRIVLALAGNVSMGLGFALFVLAPGFAVAALGAALLGVGFGTALSLYRSIITGLSPGSHRAGLVATSEAGGRIMDTLTPIAIGAGIALLMPSLGFAAALRTAGLVAVLVGAGGGVLCMLVVYLTATAADTGPVETG